MALFEKRNNGLCFNFPQSFLSRDDSQTLKKNSEFGVIHSDIVLWYGRHYTHVVWQCLTFYCISSAIHPRLIYHSDGCLQVVEGKLPQVCTERSRPTLLYNKMPGTIIIQRNANIYSRWLVQIRNKFGWFRVDLNFNQVYITFYLVLFIQTD